MTDLPEYKFPSISLLSDYREERFEVPEDELNRKMDLIRELAAARKIKIRDIRWVVGPSVTLFKIFPESGVKCSRIREMAEELPFYLNMVGVRCITMEQCMGIEIPNEKKIGGSSQEFAAQSRLPGKQGGTPRRYRLYANTDTQGHRPGQSTAYSGRRRDKAGKICLDEYGNRVITVQ